VNRRQTYPPLRDFAVVVVVKSPLPSEDPPGNPGSGRGVVKPYTSERPSLVSQGVDFADNSEVAWVLGSIASIVCGTGHRQVNDHSVNQGRSRNENENLGPDIDRVIVLGSLLAATPVRSDAVVSPSRSSKRRAPRIRGVSLVAPIYGWRRDESPASPSCSRKWRVQLRLAKGCSIILGAKVGGAACT
jgi:hypothetical protein